MNRDYEMLGVPEGAEQKEIKKAYFKLVRLFPPEKNPERFQEIRGAYERLTQVEKQEDAVALSLEMPEDSFAHAMLRQMITLERQEDYENAAETAKEAICRFGEYEAFLYELAVSQLHGGHSGSAVKNYEKLVRRYPEKSFYRRELAMAYYERGYGKKAFDAFEEAYAAGVRDNDFVLQFSLCCSERHMESRGFDMLLEMVENYDASAKTDIQDYLEAYTGLVSLNQAVPSDAYPKMLDTYADFLRTAGRALRDYTDLLSDLTYFLADSLDRPECLPRLKEILEITKKPLPERTYAKEWKDIYEILLKTRIRLDERLDEEWKNCYAAYYTVYDIYDDDIIRFIQLEEKLFLLERKDELSSQFEIIRTEYPELYGKMEDFFRLQDRENIPYILEKMRKEYASATRNINGGRYYEVYPQYKPSVEKLQWNSSEDGAYTRMGRKIGRNDPCPCGSGKKYKKCCGKQEA